MGLYQERVLARLVKNQLRAFAPVNALAKGGQQVSLAALLYGDVVAGTRYGATRRIPPCP